MCFKYEKLLKSPVKRAAYSDRTAWLMAEMSQLAYFEFENNSDKLKTALKKADFELIKVFDCKGTQAFIAKRDIDKVAVLAFRGTEVKDPRDIMADLNSKFYKDNDEAKIHDGFYKAFEYVKADIVAEVKKLGTYSLYITGHSLGGALALIATRCLDSDNLAACYTYGSPMVGNDEFDDNIKAPIYRVVNAFDIVPFAPTAYLIDVLLLIPVKKMQDFLVKFKGYEHHGDMRYLTDCGEDLSQVKVISNYNDFFRLRGFWKNKKESIEHHSIAIYSEKLAQWALKRNNDK
ncbi:MAG: lipase family protein [Candidatus Omnitrophica bacterium]|nr:lipase family protein [Candidatus Omnitrophota bacterium]